MGQAGCDGATNAPKRGLAAALFERVKNLGVGLAACVAVLAAVPAAAQSIEKQPIPLLDIRFSLEARHDDNVAHINEAAAVERGVEPEDQQLRPRASLEVAAPLGRHYSKLSADFGYDFYRTNHLLNREKLYVTAELGVNLASCQARTVSQIKRRASQFGEYDEDGASGSEPLDASDAFDNARTTLTATQSLTCGGQMGLRPFARGEVSSLDNSSELRKAANRDSRSYGAGLGYSHPSLGAAYFYYDHAAHRFENQRLPGGARRGYDVERFGFHVERDVGSRFEIAGDVSLPKVDTRGSGVSAVNGVNWSLDVKYKPLERLSLHGKMSRDVGGELFSDALYSRETQIRGELRYTASPRTTIRAVATHRRTEYYGELASIGPELTDIEAKRYEATVIHKLNLRVKLIAQLSHEMRDGNGTYYDFSSKRALIRLEFKI